LYSRLWTLILKLSLSAKQNVFQSPHSDYVTRNHCGEFERFQAGQNHSGLIASSLTRLAEKRPQTLHVLSLLLSCFVCILSCILFFFICRFCLGFNIYKCCCTYTICFWFLFCKFMLFHIKMFISKDILLRIFIKTNIDPNVRFQLFLF